MAEHIVFHPQLTKADTLILEGLRQDIKEYTPKKEALPSQNGKRANGKTETEVNGTYSISVRLCVT